MAKGAFFDRPAVIRALTQTEWKVFSKFGAFVRQRARTSLRPARKKQLSELSRREREAYDAKVKAWQKRSRDSRGRLLKGAEKKAAGRKPELPNASARPGQLPRLHTRRSPLRYKIQSGFDLTRRSLVVGPERFPPAKGGPAPERLEHGRQGWRAFPFMQPALEAESNKLTPMWRNSITR